MTVNARNHILTMFLSLFCMGIMLPLLSSCSDDSPPASISESRRTVLVYAVAANSLNSFLEDDIVEMEQGMALASDSVRWLIYEAGYETAVLKEITHDGGQVQTITLKSYTREQLSTDPGRMVEVLSDMRRFAPAHEYGLILWSHATGWNPADNEEKTLPDRYSFGEDKSQGYSAKMDIQQLAAALPDGVLDFIWADCCFMSCIETVYELRGKCRYFMAYPTEVWGSGVPYDIIVPLLMCEGNADLRSAAQRFYEYYAAKPSYGATVALIDMNHVMDVAAATRALLAAQPAVDTRGLQQYHRTSIVGPFYDFQALVQRHASRLDRQDLMTVFDTALDHMVIYKAATPRFGNLNIDPKQYSGVSINNFTDDNTATQNFYKTLSWYKEILKP